MSSRVVWLLSLALALAILDGTVIWLDRRDEAARVPASGALVEYEPAGIARVTVTRDGKTVVATRVASPGAPGAAGWALTSKRNYPARAGKVDALLERLRAWRRGRVAGDQANHDGFQVTREKGLTIKLEDYSDRVVGELIMGSLTGLDPEKARLHGGNVDPRGVGRYVRVASEDTVFVVDDFIISELEPEPRDWLESPLLGGDGEESRVRAFSLRAGGSSAITVLMDGPYPRLAGDERPLDPDKAWALAGELVRTFPLDVPEQTDEAKLGLAPPRLVADVGFKDGSQARLLLGDLATGAAARVASDSVYVKVEGKPAPVLVPRPSVAALASFSFDQLQLAHAVGERAAGQLTKLSFRARDAAVTLSKTPGGNAWEIAVVSSGGASRRKPIDETLEPLRARVVTALAKLALEGLDRGPRAQQAVASPAFTLSCELASHETFELRFGAEPLAVDPVQVVWLQKSTMPSWIMGARIADVRELRAALEALADAMR